MVKKVVKIPFNNYVKLGIIVVFTVLFAFICRNIYMNNISYEKSISIIKEVLISEINSNEVYNYIRENDNIILYIGVTNNDNCRTLEKDLKKVILDRNLENKVTYLNLTETKKKSSFIKEFNKFYGTKVLGYPSFIIFEDGKVKDIITVKTGNVLALDKVIEFLDRNNITSDYYD